MNPRFPQVNSFRAPNDDEVVSIRLDSTNGFEAFVGDERIAESLSSRRLGEWALACGAVRVSHDYDLRWEK